MLGRCQYLDILGRLAWGRMGLRGQGGCPRVVGGVSRGIFWDLRGKLLKILNAGSDGSRCKRDQIDIYFASFA